MTKRAEQLDKHVLRHVKDVLTDSRCHLYILWLPLSATRTALSRTRTETSHVTHRKSNARGACELHTGELYNQTQGDTDFE